MNKDSDEILAWSEEPIPHGIQYDEMMLRNPERVETLFVYCKEMKGVILAEGWRYLFDYFGLGELINIDKKSQWLKHEDTGEWICRFVDQALTMGYNPVSKQFGDYDPETGMFLLLDGSKTNVDWKAIYQLKDELE